MLSENLKDDVLELAAIAKSCPENLQNRCFEILLSHYLESVAKPPTLRIDEPTQKPSEPTLQVAPAELNLSGSIGGGSTPTDQDLTLASLSIRARKFLEKYGRSIDDLNQLFYKEGDDLKPLYEDLKTTKSTESQIRIALLAALREGLKSGDFVFDGELVRAECQLRKCLDKKNFAAIFKRNASLFDAFESYVADTPKVRLSESGKEQLSNLIAELR
jgi:hypothetical protein